MLVSTEIENTIPYIFTEQIESLDTRYIFRDRSAVLEFLDTHPFLVPLLIEAHEQLAFFFTSFTGYLEVRIDPEDFTDVQLFLFIKTNLSQEENRSRLNQFDQGWWLDAADRAQDKVCIMLGYS